MTNTLALCVLVLLVLYTGTACESFPPASELGEDNQVMALRATPPEIAAGDEVVLDALVHWPVGTPTLSWLVCVPDVGDNLMTCLPNQLPVGAVPPLCAADPAARACIAGLGQSVRYTVAVDAFPDDGEQHTVFVYLLASTSVDGFSDCQDTLSGGPPTFDCLLSIKRVVVSTRDPGNRNPLPAALVLDGETLDSSSVAEVDMGDVDLEKHELSLGVTLDATSVDEAMGLGPDDDPARLTVQWFSNCGEIADPIVYLDVGVDDQGSLLYDTDLTQWKPQQTGDCLLYAVVRDDNGGAGFLTQPVRILSP